MFDKFRKNKLFNILFPIIIFSAVIVLQIFLYDPLVGNRNTWALILFFVGIYICLIFFIFWLSLHILKKEEESKRLIFWSLLFATILIGIFVGIIYLVKALSHNLDAYYLSVGIVDLIIIIAVVFLIPKLNPILGKKTMIVFLSSFLIVTIGGAAGFIAYYKSPPGQRYIVENDFIVQDTLIDGENQKIKVVLLAGQSNASGASLVEYLSIKETSEKFLRYSSGYEKVYINYFNENGLNSSSGEFVPVTLSQGFVEGYFGPEVGLADTLSANYPDEQIFIIKYAWGGTNLYNQWLSPSSEGETGELYSAFTSYVKASMDYLLYKNYEAEIVAMCWMQGESDSFDDNCLSYGQNTLNLVSDIRNDLSGYLIDNGMLFVDAGISDSTYWKNYQVINQAKFDHANLLETNVYIDTIANGLTITEEPEGNPDLAHYDSLSEIKLGNLFAEAIIDYLDN